ncbi:O-Antigen ligase [Mucilaginibacter pineti]|uniref:O-Antigen ligase n=1 Tax=Mucilaginibacter pineti TaxID=1391627 RepID=A0A1G6Z2B5_9SPHI|nr:O-antigen ligase family protein [Mucilaginibacter pineti]SDD96005.1 O-Antigen ligase [Mucilaginibacter pineti]
MSVTGTGLVIIFIAFYAVIFSKKLLYELTIFFIPFSATAVLNFGEDGTGSAVQPFMFLGALWLATLFFSKVKNLGNGSVVNKIELKPIMLLIGFALVALLSLAMPLIINGDERGNVTGGLGLNDTITFSPRNISQYIYLLFGVVFAIGIYVHNKTKVNYLRTLKIYSASVFFVIIWGFVELYCNAVGLDYPAFLFNNSYNGNAAGYKFFTDPTAELKRISSVGIEPSVMVQSVVVIIPFFLFSVIKKNYIFSKWTDIGFIVLLYVFTIRTTSSSGILCLAFLTLLSLFFYFKDLPIKRKILLLISLAVLIPVIIAGTYWVFKDIIDKMLFEKSDSFSGLERLSSILDAWDTFLHHPILGAGWASVTSFDLFVKILSNTGIIGFVFFIGFLITTLINKFRVKAPSYQMAVINTAITISFCTIVFGNMINTFTFIFGTFWLISGLAIITTYEVKS